MLADKIGRRNLPRGQPPWRSFANRPTGVLIATRSLLSFVSGNDDGAAVSGITLDVGGATTTPVGQTYFRNFNSKGLGYLQMSTSGTSYIGVNAWATAVTGTAKPFTIIFTGQHPVGGAPAFQSRLFSLNNSGNSTPLIDIFMNGAGSTSFQLTRGNDAGSFVHTPTYDPGSSPFVFYVAYDGSNLYSALNYGAVTTTAANAGALTVDSCAIGAYAFGGPNLPWQGKLVGCLFNTAAILGAQAVSDRTYLCRLIGL